MRSFASRTKVPAALTIWRRKKRKEIEDDNVSPLRECEREKETFVRDARAKLRLSLFFSAAIKLRNFHRRLIFTVTLSALTLLATYRFARGQLLLSPFFSSFFRPVTAGRGEGESFFFGSPPHRDNPFVSCHAQFLFFLLFCYAVPYACDP